jgi:hypothetical protein
VQPRPRIGNGPRHIRINVSNSVSLDMAQAVKQTEHTRGKWS